MMRLVWVVIPLVLIVSIIGIVGVQESFAQETEFPLSINYFKVLDNSDNIITEISTGYPIVIKSEIKNNESLLVNYTILCQIQNEFDNRYYLSIIDDSIQGNSLKTSTSLWVPQVAGEYTIGCYVWESIDNPTELATSQTTSLLVKEEKSYAPNLGFDFTKTIDSPSITLQNTGIFKDLFYSDLNKPTQGVEILLTSDIVNTKNKLIPFTYAIQIENDQQEIVNYSEISTSLYSQETHKIIYSWIPQGFGNFTVKSITLEETYRGDFLPISESDEFKILVNEDPTFGLECPYCPTTSRIGEVQWREAIYPLNSTGIVRVIDPDKNLDPELFENYIVKVWSDSDTDGIDLIVNETNSATGIFEGSVFFTTNDKSSGDKLRVSNGDIITAKYVDDTLPEPYAIADELEIIGTTFTVTTEPQESFAEEDTSIPPLIRGQRGPTLRIIDSYGNSLDQLFVNEKVWIDYDIANGYDKKQILSYHLDITNLQNEIIYAESFLIPLLHNQIFDEDISWIPEDLGEYTITVKVFTNATNSEFFLPPVSYGIKVLSTQESFTEKSQLIFSLKKQLDLGNSPENIVCRYDLELIFKQNNSPACVKSSTVEKLIQRGWTS